MRQHDNATPTATLVMDAAGKSGTTPGGGALEQRLDFQVEPPGGEWSYSDLYEVLGQSGGAYPNGSLILKANGNVYETAFQAGTGPRYAGPGVVLEITR